MNDIKWIERLEEVNISPKYRDEYRLRKVRTSHGSAAAAHLSFEPKNFWQDTRVGRFLSLRTRAGKVAAGAVVAAGTTLLPAPIGNIVGNVLGTLIPINQSITNGGNMEILANADWIEIILIILTIGLGIAAQFLKGKTKQLLTRLQSTVKEIKEGKDLYDQFKSRESEGGTELTASEYKALAEQLGAIFNVLYKSNEEVVKDE